jgi:uncharacterized membrane protein YtjA (UPF0391 family)
MLYWAVVFLVVAIIAGLFGFGGIASASADIAQILFFIFLVLLVISLIMYFVRGRRPGTALGGQPARAADARLARFRRTERPARQTRWLGTKG